ncbi:MAG: hypothetical protein A2287_10350 [Candidatus Melainabacteria bacterium RIFOXYA12_FULL_32_12]|nr:MAG: hypothetical protein A2255_05575 [Candidatus Melainabacteria bacterium RIFOXYA2_FULL_32_9]OGI29181.1 MAG: hypothetical protein A2287_10350 [Candidatus Melainabacteria bacterium RIFOXYA12_FULL_32_12]
MQQNLTDKIYQELDMIRLLSKMSHFAIQSEAENIDQDSFMLVFEDIEKRCWQVSELIEILKVN